MRHDRAHAHRRQRIGSDPIPSSERALRSLERTRDAARQQRTGPVISVSPSALKNVELVQRLTEQLRRRNSDNFVCKTLGQEHPHCIEAKACDNRNNSPPDELIPSNIICDRFLSWSATAEYRETIQKPKEREERRQYQEAKQEEERRESERRTKFVEAREVARLAYRKDVVAQVLNYSSTGDEYGSDNLFWRQKEGPCVYELVMYAPAWAEEAINNLKNVGFLDGIPRALDLNQLNPDEIVFQTLGYSLSEPQRLQPVFTIEHQGKVIINGGPGTRQMERIQRGWSLIFQQCQGIKKPF
jgi:hypothetical protein